MRSLKSQDKKKKSEFLNSSEVLSGEFTVNKSQIKEIVFYLIKYIIIWFSLFKYKV